MDKKKVLILCYSNVAVDQRVQRQIAALIPDFKIEVCAGGDSGIKDIPFYQIYESPPFSLTRKLKRFFWLITGHFEPFYWDDYKKKLTSILSSKNYDVIIANDIHTLPLALHIAGGHSKVYFDAHEYHPKEWENDLKWRLLYQRWIKYMCKKYIPKADSFSTVTEGIAMEYKKFTGRKPVVIINAARYEELKPVEPSNPVKIIHHGRAIPQRRIENMIKIMNYLDNHILYLMLTCAPEHKSYLEKLKRLANDKVRFPDPVPSAEVCKTINKFDIGIWLLEDDNFNHIYALPNKFFDFIQARLAVVTSPNPEMKNLIETYRLGKASENYTPKSMAEAILNVSEKIPYFKSQSDQCARELNAEHNYRLIRELVSGSEKN